MLHGMNSRVREVESSDPTPIKRARIERVEIIQGGNSLYSFYFAKYTFDLFKCYVLAVFELSSWFICLNFKDRLIRSVFRSRQADHGN